MSKKSAAESKQRARTVYQTLRRCYPDAHCALEHRDAFELLVATILSAQCTDERVNKVTPVLFKKYRNARAYVDAPIEEIEEIVRSTGFFRAKARSIQGCCKGIVEKHGGRVPDTLEELTPLRGVGRKTANVVLGNAYGIPGVVVATHIKRISHRLDLTRNEDPVKIEFDLMPQLPESEWVYFAHAVIRHGRGPCKARKADCASCTLSDLCPSADV